MDIERAFAFNFKDGGWVGWILTGGLPSRQPFHNDVRLRQAPEAK